MLPDSRAQVHQRQARAACLAGNLSDLLGRAVKVPGRGAVGLQDGAVLGLVDQQITATSQFDSGVRGDLE